jgi:trehalose synthase
VRLYTTEVLVEARGLYRAAGYALASTHDEDGRRDFWLEKSLVSRFPGPVLGHVDISPVGPERFAQVLSPETLAAFERGVGEAREVLGGREVWNVNSTARGGGVAELLRPLVAYARGAGVDAHWAVIEGDPEFFEVTKRLHNKLHGIAGDGGPLGDAERRAYESALEGSAADLAQRLRPGDVVILHDPQTAGMTAAVREAGARVVWRCHIGLDDPNGHAREGWEFLRPYVLDADAYVFSRRAFVWEGLDDARIHVIAPSIDAFAPKNQDLDAETVAAVLSAAGIVPGPGDGRAATYHHQDGTPGRVDRRATVVEDEPLPPSQTKGGGGV